MDRKKKEVHTLDHGFIDDIGWKILHELQRNARLSYSELGRRVGLTPPAVADRLRRMEEAGIVRGYTVDVDPAKLGLPLTAVIRVTARGARYQELSEAIDRFPEVRECHRLTGVDCFILTAVLRSVDHLRDLVDRLMPYGETVTSLVLSSPVTHRAIEHSLAVPAPRRKGIRRAG